MTQISPKQDITLWLPEPDLVTRQAIGKLGEECGELITIVNRILIQGIDKADPKTGKPNIDALANEIADVMAATRWVRDVVIRLPAGIDARMVRKLAGFQEWQRMLEGMAHD